MRILALDPGRRKTGIAISDDNLSIALPLGIVRNNDYLDLPRALYGFLNNYFLTNQLPYDKPVKVYSLADVMDKCNIRAIIMGMPYGQGGQMTELTRELSDICTVISQLASVVVIPCDERFSSRAAHVHIKTLGIKNNKEKKSKMDEIVAVELLQGFLDGKKALILNYPPEQWLKND